MGKIVMPKNSALLNEIEAVLKIYSEENDWLDNDTYKERLKAIIGDDQYPSSYTKKAQIPAYFGLIEWEEPTNNRSRKRITPYGQRLFDALETHNIEEKFEVLMESIERTTFGRNNCGVGDSNSDVEAPNVFIRAILDLNYLTYNEFAQLLWDISDNNADYSNAVLAIKKSRILGDFQLSAAAANYADAKPIMTLIRWGFLEELENGNVAGGTDLETTSRSRKIVIPTNILNQYRNRLCDLKIYNTEKADFLITTETNDNLFDGYGKNILIYGVPGCGKSHYIKENYAITENNSERVVFHPDYTYSDFVGQILPKLNHNEETEGAYIEYQFVPGPFTRLLSKCAANKTEMFYLVIEEVNRGNAPAIFGEVFQLLDRSKSGDSEYGINNADIAQMVYNDSSRMIKIPNNLTILATMNTADQNVFTLDTAFKRRWEMLSIRNNFKLKEDVNDISVIFNAQLQCKLCNTDLVWMDFAKAVNKLIVEESPVKIRG